VDVVEPLLVRVHSSEDEDVAPADNSRVPVSGLGRLAVGAVDLVPVI